MMANDNRKREYKLLKGGSGGSGDSSSSGTSASGCGCNCIAVTNIEVNGHETSSQVTVSVGEITDKSGGGTVVAVFVGGTFTLANTGTLETPTEIWSRNILPGDVAIYDDGVEVTEDYTISGTIQWKPFLTPKAKLIVDVDWSLT